MTFVQTNTVLPSAEVSCVPVWASELVPTVVQAWSETLPGEARVELKTFRGDEVGMATAVVANAKQLSADMFRVCVDHAFRLVFKAVGDLGFPHAVRMWSFLPGIHDPLAEGMDRYRTFNLGRYDAFASVGNEIAEIGRTLPAASTVGHNAPALVISCLGLQTSGIAIENPRQTPAFAYSRVHGPRPPCFSRAMLARLPMGTRLLVSGTASIRGEDSVCPDSLMDQLEETFENLDRLVQSVQNARPFDLAGVETARVYFSRPGDRMAIVREVAERLPSHAKVEYLPALICRPELLVEIEATVAPALS